MKMLRIFKWDCIKTTYSVGWIFAIGITVFLLRFILPVTPITQNTIMPLLQMISTTLLAVVLLRSYVSVILDFSSPIAILGKTADIKAWQTFLSKWFSILLVNGLATLLIYGIMLVPKSFPLTEIGLFIPVASIAHFMLSPTSVLGGVFNAMFFGLCYVVVGSFSLTRIKRFSFSVILGFTGFFIFNQVTDFLRELIVGLMDGNFGAEWLNSVIYIIYSMICIAVSSFLWKNHYDAV